MPAASVSSLAASSNHKHLKSRLPPTSKKTRLVRRRGRGKNGFESDEDIQREVGTDTESDDDDHSSVASSVDSDTPPASSNGDVSSNGHSHVLTPNTTQSSTGVKSVPDPGPHSSTKSTKQDTAFFNNATWSEMVTEEGLDGPSELPVVDFEDFNASALDQRSTHTPPHKGGKRPVVKRAVSAPNVDRPATSQPCPPAQTDPDEEGSSLQASRVRRPGQSARLTYQERLKADPSFVPMVGEFWGHDDRLLDKNLRSMSGWWRARRQGRGRGRGMNLGVMRGRPEGVLVARSDPNQRGSAEGDSDPQEAQNTLPEVPRIDQPWVHDGYEEMRKRDERRRMGHQQQVTRSSGSFTPRGRGAYGSARGRGAAFTPLSSRSTFVPPASTPNRTWYAMKPECAWTKQHDAFLYFDATLRPRHGVGPGYRVKLPNTETKVVRGSVRSSQLSATCAPSSLESPLFDDGDRVVIVQLPKHPSGKTPLRPPPSPPRAESSTTVEQLAIDDCFVVRPELAPPQKPIVERASSVPEHALTAPSSLSTPSPMQSPLPAVSHSPTPPPTESTLPSRPHEPAQPVSMLQAVFSESPDASHHASGSSTAEENKVAEPQEIVPHRATVPAPPPLQTVFPPPTPSYSPHYGYSSTLPPGITINQHGIPYEITTGRPVYLQPPGYAPRPLAHGMITPPGMYMPGLMHHHTGSPDFLAPPHTPPIPGFIDPATGGPLFAFPRHSARVEIRSPLSKSEVKPSKSQRQPSGLRTNAAEYGTSEPASPANDPHGFAAHAESYPGPNGVDGLDGSNGSGSEQAMAPAMHGYTAYHQWYPEYYNMPLYEMYHLGPHGPQDVYY